MGYATADVGEGRRARASRLPVVDRICSLTLERARFPGPAPLVDTSILVSRPGSKWRRARRDSAVPGPRTARAVLGRPARRRAGCRPAGSGAQPRSRVDGHRIRDRSIVVRTANEPSFAVRTRVANARRIAIRIDVSMKFQKCQTTDVYKTKMGSSTVHAEESRYRRHPECLPLGTRTANMEQHQPAEA